MVDTSETKLIHLCCQWNRTCHGEHCHRVMPSENCSLKFLPIHSTCQLNLLVFRKSLEIWAVHQNSHGKQKFWVFPNLHGRYAWFWHVCRDFSSSRHPKQASGVAEWAVQVPATQVLVHTVSLWGLLWRRTPVTWSYTVLIHHYFMCMMKFTIRQLWDLVNMKC